MIDPTKSLSYNITIQCSLDGFCFVLYDIEENKIIDIELYQTSDSGDESIIMDALERAIFKKGLYEKPFHSVRFIAGNRFNTLVPEELFDEQHLEAHLLFNHRLPQGHTVKSEILPSLKAVNVYAMSTQLEARVRKLWENVQITHRSTVFLNAILKEDPYEEKTNVYVNVNSRSFDLAIVTEGKLVFFNNFKFDSKDDFVYYLMFVLEQQQLPAQDIPVYFTGLITGNSEILKLCERYIKKIRFIRPDGSVNVDMALNGTPFQYYDLPYKSLSCES